ncbi:MAG TPA: DUF6492 family protein, partial [Candidatus Xenobia bacterium]
DFDRFLLQRESYERWGVQIPHLAVVHDDEVERFRRDIPFQQNLTIMSTREVLPPWLEKRRRAKGYRRLNPLHWLTPQPLHGWMAQQLTKLLAATVVPTEGIVCLDSELAFVGPLSDADFETEDGTMHLYETVDDLDAEMGDWYVKSMRFLDVPLRHQTMYRCVHAPAVLHRDVMLELQRHVEQLHQKDWIRAILGTPDIYEYQTYGVFARHLHHLRLVAPVVPQLSLYYWWPEQIETIAQDFARRLEERPARLVLVNSNLGIDTAVYRSLIAARWPGSPMATV